MKQFAVIAAVLLSAYCQAQYVLKGIVKDENGMPYSGLKVKIEQTQQLSSTDESGAFTIVNIPPGTYALSVDYLYDIQYYTVNVPMQDSLFNIQLTRRIQFDEILVKSYQLNVAGYSNASKISGENLQQRDHEKDLPFVLRSVPGIVAQSDAGNGIGYTGIRFRGIDPSHVQININGIPFNDSESSLSYFVDIPDIVAQADDIVIFKGNAPNRSGAPSFGGAIDINTNKLQFEPRLSIKTQVGSFTSWKYSLQANSGLIAAKYNFEFGLSRQKSDGYIMRGQSDLKSFRLSALVNDKRYSARLNYLHGSERTGQAWNGLPVQFAEVDSLRTFNSAGTEKPGDPYPETDNYKQDHLQFFYQNQLSDKLVLNTSLNYTYGSGYFENYKAGQLLADYAIEAMTSNADLIKRQWLKNDFVFFNMGLELKLNDKINVMPLFTWSWYSGDHFGRVADVLLADYQVVRERYYENEGIKKEYSLGLRSTWQIRQDLSISFDLQSRNVDYKIHGQPEFSDSIFIHNQHSLLNPRIFAAYKLNNSLSFYTSLGYMQREPFREDILANRGELKKEELLDFELGFKFHTKEWSVTANAFWMNYSNQLALSGAINDVGEALRINLDHSYRLGLEIESAASISSRISLWNASLFSVNKIPDITEVLQFYGLSSSGPISIQHENTDLSFSPSQVITSGMNYQITSGKSDFPEVELRISHNFVSDYYLDNYANASSLVHGYHNVDISLNLESSIPSLGKISFWLTITNFLNEKYFSHGWISSRFKSETPINPADDRYIGSEGSDIYYYKGLYPQALRHFNCGVRIVFH